MANKFYYINRRENAINREEDSNSERQFPGVSWSTISFDQTCSPILSREESTPFEPTYLSSSSFLEGVVAKKEIAFYSQPFVLLAARRKAIGKCNALCMSEYRCEISRSHDFLKSCQQIEGGVEFCYLRGTNVITYSLLMKEEMYENVKLTDMETVKEYLGYVNPHWIAVVVTGMYTHLRQICIIGLCFDEDNNGPPFDPSYASVLFTFSVLCLLAEYRLWPRTLKEPPIQLLYIYEMLVAALTTNLATRAIWVPFMHVIYCLTQESSKCLIWLNAILGLGRYSFLCDLAYYMAKDCAATHMAFCMSILSFVWMLDATESLDAILDTWAK
ncbi:hypothetical protein APICC_05633 [Apis cerana cerana]|nr:hypothetical protein APICC_05633 [Apis cerana cerana]